MIHYVYLTTNLINGKRYVGDHMSENINDNYLGSEIYHFKFFKSLMKNVKIKVNYDTGFIYSKSRRP